MSQLYLFYLMIYKHWLTGRARLVVTLLRVKRLSLFTEAVKAFWTTIHIIMLLPSYPITMRSLQAVNILEEVNEIC